ncbi:MAG TPA: hypothetical protein VFN51_01100 [Candidatus Saccharimonadales bacterium]|nr:hypothetical protein [Candidatus Saccharimonadales bacterium]
MGKVLLIEPDFILARTYKVALETVGHTVIMVSGAQSGISAADDCMPDAVVMEIQLIEHSGIEFLYEFRSYPEWQAIPVIIHSQIPPSEFAGSWEILKRDLGVNAYLYKTGTTLGSLIKTVEGALTPVNNEPVQL